MSMNDEMRKAATAAGVDLDETRLRAAAERALEVNAKRPDEAIGPFVRAVTKDMKLLIALIGWEEIHDRAERYLRDQRTESSGASQECCESHVRCDRPAPLSGGESLSNADSQCGRDLSATQQEPSGRSHVADDSHSEFDRPGGSPTSMTRRGAAMVASGIWEVEIGGPQRRLGNLTRKDVINAERRATITATACRRLLTEIHWPDNKTPLRAFADAATVQRIRDEAIAALPEPPEDVRHE